MIFKNWKMNIAFEAAFCIFCAATTYAVGYVSIFALSLIFLFILVPFRGVRSYLKNSGEKMNDSVGERNGITFSEITPERVAGAAAFGLGGMVDSAPFYVAGDLLPGRIGTGFTVTGTVIDTGFNIGAAHSLIGQVRARDLPGIIVGSVVAARAGPVAGLAAGIAAEKTDGRPGRPSCGASQAISLSTHISREPRLRSPAL